MITVSTVNLALEEPQTQISLWPISCYKW